MSIDFSLSAAAKGDVAAIVAMLEKYDLPTPDIDERLLRGFVVARPRDASPNELAGICGIEIHGSTGLLRSLAVASDWRDRSLGRILVEDRLAWSRRTGLQEMYLLTMDAAGYFTRFGFTRLERSELPPEIQATSQFSSLCPATAVAMVRRAASPLPGPTYIRHSADFERPQSNRPKKFQPEV